MTFLGLDVGSPESVYNKDIEDNVKKCDAFLAVIDFPSIGIGWELGVADTLGIPTLMVVKRAIKFTRLAQGAAAVRPT